MRQGFSLVELLVVLAILGVALGIGFLNLRPFYNPLEDAQTRLRGHLNLVRGKAMATTSAYRVRPQGDRVLVAEWARRCSDTTWTGDPSLRLELPQEVRFAQGNWSLCFNSRGYADRNLVIRVEQPGRGFREVEVLLGGGVVER